MTATFETTQVQGWIGRDAVDVNGDKIGRIEAIYEDEQGSGPEWFAITTGWFGTKITFAPVHGATIDGDRVRLRWDKDVVKDAPRTDADEHLSEDDEDRLYGYYGMEWSGTGGTGTTTGGTTATSTTTAGTTGRRSGGSSGGDDAMTRSEEELDVSTRQREVGRARLRKWVETEQVNVTVPVRREVARLVTEPVTDANLDKALDGPDIKENEHDVVLHEEEIVVDKKTVPKERVRLETDVVAEERNVTDEVRKERIGLEGEAGTRGTER